jgi:hypothetical protein
MMECVARGINHVEPKDPDRYPLARQRWLVFIPCSGPSGHDVRHTAIASEPEPATDIVVVHVGLTYCHYPVTNWNESVDPVDVPRGIDHDRLAARSDHVRVVPEAGR